MPQHVNPPPLTVGISALKTILYAGLLAGTLDILAACINAYASNGVLPVRVLQYIASGWFGTKAFAGGTAMAIYGLLFHYLIATTWAVLFFLVYPRLSILAKNRMVTGVVYGVVVWFLMNVVVLPRTNIPNANGGIKFPDAFLGMGILIIAVGLPIAIIVHRHYKK